MQGLGTQVDPGVRRIILERQDVRCIDHPRVLTVVPGGGERRLPVLLLIDPAYESLIDDRQRLQGAELQPLGMQVVQELSGAPGAISADQDPLTDQVAILVVEVIGQPGQRLGEDADMVCSAVGSLATGAHLHHQHLACAVALTVVDHGVHRREPVPALVGALNAIHIGVHVHQRRVNVDHKRIGTACTDGRAALACGGSEPRTDLALHRGEGVVERAGMIGEPGVEAADRRLGGPGPNTPPGSS